MSGEIAEKACGCGCGCGDATVEVPSIVMPGTPAAARVTIKVLGGGCKSCHALLENTKDAVAAMGLAANIEYVTDLMEIMKYNVMTMPALIVNDKVVALGKVLKKEEVSDLLAQQGY